MKAYWVANYTEIKDDERLKKISKLLKQKKRIVFEFEKYSGYKKQK